MVGRHHVESKGQETLGPSAGGPFSLPSLRPAAEHRGPGNKTGGYVLLGSRAFSNPPLSVVQAFGELSPYLSLQPNRGCLSGSEVWDLVPPFWAPEETEGQLSWAPNSLRDDSWVGCELALKKPPAEICSS